MTMTGYRRRLRHGLGTFLSAAILLQVGPCTGDLVREQLGAGLRTTINGFFSSITDQVVTEVFNLP
jgi:hypothetical protein